MNSDDLTPPCSHTAGARACSHVALSKFKAACTSPPRSSLKSRVRRDRRRCRDDSMHRCLPSYPCRRGWAGCPLLLAAPSVSLSPWPGCHSEVFGGFGHVGYFITVEWQDVTVSPGLSLRRRRRSLPLAQPACSPIAPSSDFHQRARGSLQLACPCVSPPDTVCDRRC